MQKPNFTFRMTLVLIVLSMIAAFAIWANGTGH